MARLALNDTPLDVRSIHRVAPGRERDAAAAAARDGMDHLTFRIGGDTFVSSRVGKDVGRVGDVVTLDGRVGRVTAVEHRVNDLADLGAPPRANWPREKAKAAAIGAGAGGAIGAGAWVMWLTVSEAFMMGAGAFALGVVLPGLLVAGAAMGAFVGYKIVAGELAGKAEAAASPTRPGLLDHFATRI